MKKILIAPRHEVSSKFSYLGANHNLTDFFSKEGFLPFIACIDSRLKSQAEVDNFILNYLDNVDGVVLQGGEDINPIIYTKDIRDATWFEKLSYRDKFELRLVKLCIQKELPLLGVCRGMQMINVACGGRLYQDLKDFDQKHINFLDKAKPILKFEHVDLEPLHHISLSRSGFLRKTLKKSVLVVNSIHQQGIKDLGSGLEIEGESEDGLVEGISLKKGKILGLQWHPEFLSTSEDRQILISWLQFL